MIPIKLHLNVTPECIQNGVRGDGARCPVANALRKCMSTTGRCEVWRYISIAIDNQLFSIKTPVDVFSKICAYDDTGEMEPFEFELDMEEGII